MKTKPIRPELIREALTKTYDQDPAWQGPRDPFGFVLPEHADLFQVQQILEGYILAANAAGGQVVIGPGHELARFLTHLIEAVGNEARRG